MAGQLDAERPTEIFPRAVIRGGLALAAAILVGMGFVLGQAGSRAEWHEGSAFVGSDQALISVDGDGEYGLSQSVAWIDAKGSHHQDGWPECLDVPAGTLVKGVRFATVYADLDGVGHLIVQVDCRTP